LRSEMGGMAKRKEERGTGLPRLLNSGRKRPSRSEVYEAGAKTIREKGGKTKCTSRFAVRVGTAAKKSSKRKKRVKKRRLIWSPVARAFKRRKNQGEKTNKRLQRRGEARRKGKSKGKKIISLTTTGRRGGGGREQRETSEEPGDAVGA